MPEREIESSINTFRKISFPTKLGELVGESIKADLVLLETQITGLMISFCASGFNEVQKKQFVLLKSELLNTLSPHLDSLDPESRKYYEKLMKIAQDIELSVG